MTAATAAFAATLAPAQAQFTSVTGFGDSYADTGAAPGGAFQLSGVPCIYAPNCTFTGSTTFVQSLQVDLWPARDDKLCDRGGANRRLQHALRLQA